MEKLKFPVHKLNDNISRLLSQVKSAQIPKQIQDGLRNEIKWEDCNGKITDIAYLDCSNRVHLSSAYCQFLWIICNIAIKTYDAIVFELELEAENPEIRDRIIEGLNDYNKKGEEYDTIREIYPLNKVLEETFEEFKIASKIKQYEVSESDMETLYGINMNNSYGGKTNSVFSYGIVFILLHELAHFRFKHDIPDKKDESDADNLAFWDLYSDVIETEKITASLGVLSALSSLLFFSDDLKGDDQHPDEDDRIFEIFDYVKDDCNNYSGVIVQFFKLWAYDKGIENFPTMLKTETFEQMLSSIKAFIEQHKL